jgi:integrase
MTIMALQTAARRGEIVGLTWEAVHPETIELTETKGGKNRTVRLSDDARAVLVMLRPQTVESGQFVFEPDVDLKTVMSRIRREWRHAWKEAKLAPKNTVKEIAGHASLKTTERYLHSNSKIQQAAVGKLSNFGC